MSDTFFDQTKWVFKLGLFTLDKFYVMDAEANAMSFATRSTEEEGALVWRVSGCGKDGYIYDDYKLAYTLPDAIILAFRVAVAEKVNTFHDECDALGLFFHRHDGSEPT